MVSLKPIFRQLLIHAAAGAAGGGSDEWIRLYSDLLYIYRFGLPEVRSRPELPQPVPSDRLEGDRAIRDRLAAQEQLLLSLVGTVAHDPSPQPSLQSVLDRPDIQLEAARDLAEQLEGGLTRLRSEIERLEARASEPAKAVGGGSAHRAQNQK